MTKMKRLDRYFYVRVLNVEGFEEDLFLTENELHRLRERAFNRDELQLMVPDLTWRERIAKWLLT
jgi:hypothetical protein